MSKIIELKNNENNNKKKGIFTKIAFLVVILYIILVIYLIFKTPSDTVVVEQGTLTEEEMATGYVIRNEEVIKGKNYKNGMYPILSEGDKAAKNETVFRYYGKSEEELQENINDVNKKIQDAISKEKTTIFSADAKNLEDQIDKKVENLKDLNDIQTISEYKKELSDIVDKKAKIIGENSKSGSYVKKLMDEKEKYEKELTNGSEYVKAPDSGIVSYRVDGFEQTLKTDNLENLDFSDLEKLDIKTGKIVPTNNESAKIIRDFSCYIAVDLNSNSAKQAKVGQKVVLNFSGGEDIKSEIEYKKDGQDGKTLIIFKAPVLTDELMSYRKLSFNITWWSYSGLKVPNRSIINQDNLQYVVKKSYSGEEKILVKVLKNNDNYSIIGTYTDTELQNLGLKPEENKDKINVYDTILGRPKNK